jgi:Activator of Hsp90 ATPase homolog 1-like protein
MVVNVCPAAVTVASPARVWGVLTKPDRFGEWVDARFLRAEPPGPARAGQRIVMSAPSLGRRWPVTIDVESMDPQRRWIELLVRLPFGVTNQERVTLTETEAGGTLVRFN